jgi:NAD(P)-dependent dehydrogenase (short-subunit alcohol dehydrogenase family)
MAGRLEQRVALVTGASRGIGRAIVERLAAEGARVAIHYYPAAERATAEELAEHLRRQYGTVTWAGTADLRDNGSLGALVDGAEAALGPLDILVNNAGIAPFAPFFSVTETIWDDTFGTNVRGLFFLTQRVARGMVARHYGKIVNVASTASVVVTSPVIPHYIASKGAVLQLTRALAIELGPYGINVNAVGPSTVRTALTEEYLAQPGILEKEIAANPMRRLGTPEQIAAAVAFLVSDDAEQVNGHLLMVDGGLSVKAPQPPDHLHDGTA